MWVRLKKSQYAGIFQAVFWNMALKRLAYAILEV
jgi:hypothetical protein